MLLGVSGGVACFKAAALCSALAKRHEVRVVMTEAATRFVTPLTFQSLSGHAVHASVWGSDTSPASEHVGLARWCDLYVVAPATADTLAQLAHGLTPSPVSLVANALPGSTPMLLAPAMNSDMWLHPATQRNVALLRELLPGTVWVGPDAGWQACRTEGTGRMAEPVAILEAVEISLRAIGGRRGDEAEARG